MLCLQTRNTSTTYSSSLKDLLQRKISALEQQIQHHPASLTSHSDSDDDDGHHVHDNSHHEDHHEDHHDDEDHGDHDDGHNNSHHDNHHDDDDHHDDNHDDSHHDDGSHDNSHQNNGHYDNEVSEHAFERLPYHSQGHRGASNGLHSKLDAVLNHLQHRLADTGKIPVTFDHQN